MHTPLVLLVSASSLLVASSAMANIMDTFDSGTRGDLGYIANQIQRGGFSAEVSGGNLTWTREADFAPWVLAKSFNNYDLSSGPVGSRIELSFGVTASGFTNWGRNFWFGLYHNPGAPLTADVDWINDPSLQNFSGYFARVATNTHQTSQLTGGSYGATTVGSAVGITWAFGEQDNVFTNHGLGDNVQNYYWLEILKSGASEYTLSLWHNNVNDKGSATSLASVLTPGGNLVTGGSFNTLVFSTEGAPAGTLDFDHVAVVVPEPSTYALLFGLSVLGMVIIRRRK